jgi:TonB-dependent SusC/RagA subfamily outer membrane receptor
VELMQSAILGSDIIVVAYGTANREEFVGAATQVSAQTFQKREITSVTQIVEGASPGVLISPGSGQPGSSPNIRIRGIGSVGSSNAPLIVVDGAIFAGELTSINPNDIESLSILKDAASTSLYGSGAANGVIMITTKQGTGKGR